MDVETYYESIEMVQLFGIGDAFDVSDVLTPLVPEDDWDEIVLDDQTLSAMLEEEWAVSAVEPEPNETQPIDRESLLESLIASAPARVGEWSPGMLEAVRTLCSELLWTRSRVVQS